MSQPQNELIKQDLESPQINDGEIDLLGLVQILGEEKRLLLGLPF